MKAPASLLDTPGRLSPLPSRRFIPLAIGLFMMIPAGPLAADGREFTLKVLPLIKAKCLGCHGEDPADLKGDLDVRGRDALIRGGESGDPAIVAGKPDESLLYQAVAWEGLEMPPKENDRLSTEEVALVRSWIKAGAPWPDEPTQQKYRDEAKQVFQTEEGQLFATSGGTSDQWTYRRYEPEDLWAFRPIPDSTPPIEIDSTDQGGDRIDHFINRRLSEAEVPPAPAASPAVLIRRATFDLTGLPPTPADVDAFTEAWREDSRSAWMELVDRLIDSPQYGERQAQHWLDVTRYADTGGMSNDFERSNLWRYRDYVIRSFNQDKRYDEFIVEQIAGDELADESVRRRSGGDESVVRDTQLSGQYTPAEAEWIVATGFLRLGPWDNAMIETDEATQIYLDDVVNVVGQTFLSTTLRCVKCHDHKFDPIPTRDYYRLYAAFSTTRMAERPVPLLEGENRAGFESGRAHVERMLDFAVQEKNKLVDLRETAAKAWFDEHGLDYQDEQQRKGLPDDKKPPRHVGLDHVQQGQLKVREQDEWIWKRRLERYEPMAQSVYNAGDRKLAWNGARKLRIDKSADRRTRPKNHILLGGALTALGDPVGPGVLSAAGVMVNPQAQDPFLLNDSVDGRRLQLARWIANPENPLTVRSIVNRIWQSHFGHGIARNPNNFGVKGAKPTHPELLDLLAAEFIAGGWKIKRLHRMIMLSDAYQRDSVHPRRKRLDEIDPDNHWLAYFPKRRLSAEEIRDAMLTATGEINLDAGGLPVMPEINMEVALQPRMIQFSLAPAYQPSPTPRERNRRTIYAYRVRGQAAPFLELFNQPNPNESCERRDTAAVTPRAFTLLNSDAVTDRSIALASRLRRVSDELESQLAAAFRILLGRDADDDEIASLVDYVQEMQAYHRDHLPEPVTYPTGITRSLVEEFSGKPFEYHEILPVFENYQPDAKPADVSAETRALADACLLLLNTNEFIYLR